MARMQIAQMSFAKVYPLLVQKAERKGRTKEEVDQVLFWLTGYDAAGLQAQLEADATYKQFFASAPRLNPNRSLITGKICGVDVSAIKDPVEQNARYLDKLVDELARGRAMERSYGHSCRKAICGDRHAGAPPTASFRHSSGGIIPGSWFAGRTVGPGSRPNESKQTRPVLTSAKIKTAKFTCHFAKYTMLLLQSKLCTINRNQPRKETMRSRIRELRRAQKLSQAELADAVGTTRQTITSIEVGKYTASLPLAYKIARYFGLTIEEVFDFSEIDEEL